MITTWDYKGSMLWGIFSLPAVLRVLSGVYTGARKKSARHRLVLRCFSPEAYSPCLVPLFLMVPYSHKLQAESVWLFGEQFMDLAVIYVFVVWKRNTRLFAEYHKSNEPKLHHNMLLCLVLKRVSFKRFICPRVQAPPCLTQFSVGYPVSRLVHQGFLSRPVPLWLPWTQCSMILSGSHSDTWENHQLVHYF